MHVAAMAILRKLSLSESINPPPQQDLRPITTVPRQPQRTQQMKQRRVRNNFLVIGERSNLETDALPELSGKMITTLSTLMVMVVADSIYLLLWTAGLITNKEILIPSLSNSMNLPTQIEATEMLQERKQRGSQQ